MVTRILRRNIFAGGFAHGFASGFASALATGVVSALLGAALPASGAAAARAQNAPRGFGVTGQVRDPRGAPVAEAAVTLKREGDTVSPVAKTDAAGRFRFDGVLKGSYSVEVAHDGFEPAVKGLQIQGRAPAPLTITLALALVVTKVTVVGESAQVSTDISENRDKASADQNLLEKVPVFDQDYVAAMSAFLDPSAVGTSGVQTIVNGVEVSSVTVSASAIQEVRINQNPYSAEYARPGRGGLEIITKEAGAAYHGAFNFTFRDSTLNAREPFALVRAPSSGEFTRAQSAARWGTAKRHRSCCRGTGRKRT